MENDDIPTKDKHRVDVWMPGSLREAVRLKAAKRGLLIGPYIRDLLIQDTGWEAEDGK